MFYLHVTSFIDIIYVGMYLSVALENSSFGIEGKIAWIDKTILEWITTSLVYK